MIMPHPVTIRPIAPEDNADLARVIRRTLEEFGANHPGTVYFDASTDHLFELFQSTPRAHYFVALTEDTLLGGGGIFPTPGLPPDTCELVKMYLLPQGRGTGLGSRLITLCLETAREAGFSRIYLETMPELRQALKAYEKLGFRYIDHAMGESGHFGCGLWMIKEL